MLKVLECIDAGSEYCPCHLAEVGECIMCSQLQGMTFCDCRNWKGVCIYHEFVSNRQRKKESRKSMLCELITRDEVSDDLVILKIKVSKSMARELNTPGAYVFLRSREDPSYYETPMSIMIVDEEECTLTTALQIRGVKTKVLKDLKEEIEVRGPYWNGLMGLKYIKTLKNSKALLVARGIGQASALPTARKLVRAGNAVKVILDKGRSGINFAEPYFRELGCDIVEKQVLDSESLEIPNESIKFIRNAIIEDDIKLVFSGGSEKLHEGISKILKPWQEEVFFVSSNDGKFCCGEGICGSCQTRLADGSRIKTCKTQFTSMKLFEGRKEV